MRIWVTEIGEPLPFENNARLLRYGMMCPEWVKLGHKVTWWTSSFSHATRTFVRAHDAEEVWEGVRLKVLHGPGYQKSVSIGRVWHQMHFARRFAEEAPREQVPDLIISPIPTIEVARAAIRLGRQQKAPVFVDIRDEWPEEFLDLFPSRARRLARLALAKSFFDVSYICRNATGIIGTGKKFLDYGLKYAKRPAGPQDAVFPFGYQVPSYSGGDLDIQKAWWIQQGVRPDKFVIVFFGTIGNFFALETVLAAARIISDELPVQFVICGSGSNLQAMKKMAADLPNVFFPGWVNGLQISSLMKISKLGLAPYRLGARMSLPNKPIEYLAGGLAVVSSLPGELEKLLSKFDCGRFYQADDPEGLVAIVKALVNDPVLLEKLRRNARSLFATKFRADQIAGDMINHFQNTLSKPNSRFPT